MINPIVTLDLIHEIFYNTESMVREMNRRVPGGVEEPGGGVTGKSY